MPKSSNTIPSLLTIISTVVSVFSISVLLWDYLITQHLKMEGAYVAVALLILLSNIFKAGIGISVMLDLAIIVLATINFPMLQANIFGYAYASSTIPMTINLAFCLNVAILIVSVIDLGNIWVKTLRR